MIAHARFLLIATIFLTGSLTFGGYDLSQVPSHLDYNLHLDADKMQKDLLCLIRKNHGVRGFAQRLQLGKDHVLSIKPSIEDWQSDDYFRWVQMPYEELNFVERLKFYFNEYSQSALNTTIANYVFHYHFVHSSPLIDRTEITKSDTLKLEQLLGHYSQFTKFYMTEEQVDPQTGTVFFESYPALEATHNINLDSSELLSINFHEKGQMAPTGYHIQKDGTFSELSPADITFREPSHFADKFVELMMNKAYQSLSPMQLIEELSRRMNNDTLSALGVIGYSFERERKSVCFYHRKALCFLGGRMKPLITPGEILTTTSIYDGRNERFDDWIGYNYHFWGYLNSGLQGKSGLDFGSYMNEIRTREYAPDYGDYIVDVTGFHMGQYIFRNIDNPTIKCP